MVELLTAKASLGVTSLGVTDSAITNDKTGWNALTRTSMINKPQSAVSTESVASTSDATGAGDAVGPAKSGEVSKAEEVPDLVLEENGFFVPPVVSPLVSPVETCLQRSVRQDPPWKQPCTVVESLDRAGGATGTATRASVGTDAEKFNGTVNQADYPELKRRLEPVGLPSGHSRQSLYRDRFTGQFWLGIKACMSHFSCQIEVLKPLRAEVAESLTGGSVVQSLVQIH